MPRREPLLISAILVLSIILPVLSNNGPSLRGVLQALERRRRAPPGITYPLSSFQYPERALEYLEANADNVLENEPGLFEPNDDRQKTLVLNYLGKDLDYPPDDLGSSYKKSAFRERLSELKARRKKIMEKKRSSAFRELAGKHEAQSEQLKELFLNELAEEEERERESAQMEADAEYVEMLKELWDKYKYSRPEPASPETLARLSYKKRNIRKRQIPGEYSPAGWGAVAFKKKRSPNQRLDDEDTPNDFLYSLKFLSQSDPSDIENFKDEKVSDDGEDPDVTKIIFNREQDPRSFKYETDGPEASDIRDEYMLSLQPINNEEASNGDQNEFPYASEKKKRFPVTKRSDPSTLARRDLVKRNFNLDSKSAGTNSKVMKDLSSIFGEMSNEDSRLISKPVKRSNMPDDTSHEIKAPTAGILVNNHHGDNSPHNHSHEEHHDQSTHEQIHSRHEHENKPPLLSGPISNESEQSHEDIKKTIVSEDKSQLTLEHPIILKKKSIDWSNYFGIDRRRKKSYDNLGMNSMRNLYLRSAKRNLNRYGAGDIQLLNEPLDEPINEEGFERKQKTKQIEELKLDNMDNKLKNMESVIVDEALQYSGNEEGLDTKEQQEIKEKILSRLAAAYSLEKMRKALKEFKTSLQSQRKNSEPETDMEKRPANSDDMKKKKKSDMPETDNEQNQDDKNGIKEKLEMDFEGEQGAGHYLNGPDEPLSEGYMGGSGMRGKLSRYEGLENGQCPVLTRIVNRCQSIDILAGDYGQLFLPLCSLHQICYLCGPSSPTGCDLIFLSEADSVCGGRTKCQKTARTTLMVLRDEHDSLADDMEGECERGSCLYQKLEINSGWQHTYKR